MPFPIRSKVEIEAPAIATDHEAEETWENYWRNFGMVRRKEGDRQERKQPKFQSWTIIPYRTYHIRSLLITPYRSALRIPGTMTYVFNISSAVLNCTR
ncbi:hypothetical protein CDAR_175681 [Caerostris darwini]|uniref:Uncharacterized protein n=1 Tax=Caerostris darwini TaxID=1538125 RepID=A0AAV4X5E6_9ARAC|nr:hypothetical protein CDAR_175681 [Caerostris darwini]